MDSKQIPIYVDPELIQAVKLKASNELKNKTASGVVDWLIKKYLNADGSQ
jgi:hypothetical protein